jgi:hypothetical protein
MDISFGVVMQLCTHKAEKLITDSWEQLTGESKEMCSQGRREGGSRNWDI